MPKKEKRICVGCGKVGEADLCRDCVQTWKAWREKYKRP